VRVEGGSQVHRRYGLAVPGFFDHLAEDRSYLLIRWSFLRLLACARRDYVEPCAGQNEVVAFDCAGGQRVPDAYQRFPFARCLVSAQST